MGIGDREGGGDGLCLSGGTESLKKEASHLNLMSIFKKSRTRLPRVRVIWRVITDDSLNDSPYLVICFLF